jgi:dipeptidase
MVPTNTHFFPLTMASNANEIEAWHPSSIITVSNGNIFQRRKLSPDSVDPMIWIHYEFPLIIP